MRKFAHNVDFKPRGYSGTIVSCTRPKSDISTGRWVDENYCMVQNCNSLEWNSEKKSAKKRNNCR